MKKLLCLFGALFAVLMVNAQKVDWKRPVSTNNPVSWMSQEDWMTMEKLVYLQHRPRGPRLTS